ncbi:hypothetical protein [Terrarubrum flagellatum]|uniref:hypothetical protein n=1 Tax=Terrirubrum flagellatum TaxID=2895980 RepID=UPI003144F6BE
MNRVLVSIAAMFMFAMLLGTARPNQDELATSPEVQNREAVYAPPEDLASASQILSALDSSSVCAAPGASRARESSAIDYLNSNAD